MEVERGIQQLDEMIEGEKLRSHAGLVTEEVAFLSLWSVLKLIERCKHCRDVNVATTRITLLTLHSVHGYMWELPATYI